MASADLDKHTPNKACSGISRHNYRDSEHHSNPDIDPTLSHLNRHYGPQTSAEFRAKYNEMVRAFDSKLPPKRIMKDRKTSLGIEICDPREGMTPEQSAAWSEASYKVIERMFEGQVVGGSYHADEVHRYPGKVDKQEHVSRRHTHIEVIAWTDAKGVNMDAFYRRGFANRINAALDEACMEMFGIPYRDGSQAKSLGPVEKLKTASAKIELERLEDKVDYAKGVLETVQIQTAEERKLGEKIYKPYVDAVERLMQQLEKLKPKEREKEQAIFAMLEKSKRVFGTKDTREIAKETSKIRRESERIEERYFAPVEEPEEWEYD